MVETIHWCRCWIEVSEVVTIAGADVVGKKYKYKSLQVSALSANVLQMLIPTEIRLALFVRYCF